MLDVQVAAEMPVAPADVSAFLFDPRNDPAWIGGLVEVYPPEGPLAVGTRVERMASFMGRRIEYVLEVERLQAGRELAMRSVKAPFPMQVTYLIEPRGERSLVTLRVQGGGGLLMRLMGPVNAWQVKRNLRADLVRLRGCLGG